jgi:hypothetical protein
MSKKIALFVFVTLALGAFWLFQRGDQVVIATGPLSPWDALTSSEITAASEAVRIRDTLLPHGSRIQSIRNKSRLKQMIYSPSQKL